jgi:hypothetical protein
MAIGDDALAAGFSLVPQNGTGGEVRSGATEINRTRDYIAQVRALIAPVSPVTAGGTGSSTVSGARTNLGIRSGTANPSDAVGGSTDGNIYFKII